MSADILVQPHDMLFVGPPHSMTAGETNRVRGLFPPPPTTFQGAIRSHILRCAGVALSGPGAKAGIRALVGEPDAFPPGCSIAGPWIAEAVNGGARVRGWFPVPRWVAQRESSMVPRPPVTTPGVRFDLVGFEPLDISAGFEPAEGWVPAEALARLLAGEPVAAAERADLPAGIEVESRPGVALETDRRTPRRGMLYVDEGYRFPATAGLAAEVTWTGLDAEATAEITRRALRIGARGRLASVLPRPPWDTATRNLWRRPAGTQADDAEKTRAWVYLATPAYLEDPGDPGLDAGDLRVTVRTPALGKPLLIGGFRMETGSPRPLRPFVPAGSGWLVEVAGGTATQREAAIERWHARAVVGAEHERPMGCGTVLVGYGATTTIGGL